MKKLNMLLLAVILGIFGSSCKKDDANTEPTIVDSRDGEIYKTVMIGNQHWMAENLRYNAPGSWENPSNPSNTYGRLYDWNTVMASSTSSNTVPSSVQGICPSGWHIPSDEEWKVLEMHLGMNQATADSLDWRGTNQAAQLKSTSGWFMGLNGTNSSGFNALPAGEYYSGFDFLSKVALFWSSTEEATSKDVYIRQMQVGTDKVYRFVTFKSTGYSCRCLED